MEKSCDANTILPGPSASPGRFGRTAYYIREMFPPAVCVPAGLANFAAVYFSIQALDLTGPMTITLRSLAGALTTLLFLLLLRVYDDLKDADSDLRYATAGDPRYAYRSIVAGRVQLSDVSALRSSLTALLVGINLPLGFPLPLLVFASAMVLFWLSYHWFFWPAIQRNLLLAFATHNAPLSLALSTYAAAVAMRDFGITRHFGTLSLVMVGLWLPISSWEVSRKIRHRDEETEYVTYTKLLGYRAVLLPVAFVSVSTLCLIYVGRIIGLSWILPAVLVTAGGVLVSACIRFLLFPSAGNAKLQTYAELFLLAAWAGLPLSILFHYGVRFR